MASNISIITSPPTYSPVYNPVEFCVKEVGTPGGTTIPLLTNYHFVFDIVIEALGTIRTNPLPLPVTLLGVQNVGGIIEGYVKEQIAQYNSTGSFVFGITSPIIKYYITVYSAWDVAGVYTVDPDVTGGTTSGNFYVWSACFPKTDWITQINDATPFNTWILNVTNGSNGEFLTSYKTPKVRLLDLGWHWILTDTPTDTKLIEVYTYDADGVQIQQVQSVNATSTAVTNSKLLSVSTSPQSLNNIAAALLMGSQPIITSSVASYTVEVQNAAFAPVSEMLTFTIEEACNYDIYRIHFENYLGGFDAYNFTLKSTITETSKKQTYTKSETIVDASGLVYKHEDNGTVAYNVKSKTKLKLESDYLTAEQNTWLKQLIQTPQAYLEFDAGGVRNFKPVLVTSDDWVNRIESEDKLFRLSLEIDLGHEDFRQRR